MWPERYWNSKGLYFPIHYGLCHGTMTIWVFYQYPMGYTAWDLVPDLKRKMCYPDVKYHSEPVPIPRRIEHARGIYHIFSVAVIVTWGCCGVFNSNDDICFCCYLEYGLWNASIKEEVSLRFVHNERRMRLIDSLYVSLQHILLGIHACSLPFALL